MNNKASDDLIAIASQFTATGRATAVQPFGSGNIGKLGTHPISY
jgi:hypothetical protein